MKTNSFWSDASRCGAIVGLVSVAFSLLGLLVPSIAFVCNLLSFVAMVYLLFYFTRKRASQFTADGFTYSQSLGFIVGSAVFVGIVSAAFQIVAGNFLFTEQFEQTISTTVGEMQKSGIYDAEMIKQMASAMRTYMFSPIAVLLSQVFGNVLYLGFLGLFISVGTKCEPVLFDIQNEEEEDDDEQSNE
ncbi:MAG: DUF4199 domain-containing protein [Alistipes sp.]|nr:DUF4199 domain-containing protein [Alistipes sp.]